jgi:N6-adenosine-specific RNA methylase IME4
MRMAETEIVATVTEYVERIRLSLVRSVSAIIETGLLLQGAKRELRHGDFLDVVQLSGISPRSAQMFMSIAACAPLMKNANSVSHFTLPPSFGALYELSRIEPEILEQAIESGEVHAGVTRSEAKAISRRLKVPSSGETPELFTGTAFACVVADPPWQYVNTATRGAADDHYPTMSMEELVSLGPSIETADDAHLWLWVTNPFLREGFELIEAWSFEYRTTLTWCKPQIGLGNYLRSATEHVLFATRGSLPIERRDVPTYFVADRKRHSQKPDAFYEIVTSCSPGPRLELFSRTKRDGFVAWGLEAQI